MSSKKSRNRNRSIASNAADGEARVHRVTESRRDVSRVRRELHESIVTDTGVTEKKLTQIKKTESERLNSESFQTHGSSQSADDEQRADNLSISNAGEKPSNVPDLDELADRIAASGYGGFSDGFGDSGSGGSGSDDGSSSSSCGDGPCPDEEPPCEGLTDNELFCCENPDADCCTEDGSGGCTSGQCPIPNADSEQPIRYFNGELRLSASDLSASRLGGTMGHRRSYSNQMSRNHDYGTVTTGETAERSSMANWTSIRSTRMTTWAG